MDRGKSSYIFFSGKRKKNTKVAENGLNIDLTIQIERE